MPRRKKEDTFIESVTEDELTDEALRGLCDSESIVIQLGREMVRKASIEVKDVPRLESSKKTSLIEESALKAWETPLETDQILYINARSIGLTSKEACKALGFHRMQPQFWEMNAEKEGVYMSCLKAVEECRTRDLEDIIWKQAAEDQASAILKMFAIKAKKDEYKDNAPPQAQMQTNIHVTIDGNRFEVDTALKEIGEG